MIKAAVFDLDGTILDSMPFWDSAPEKYLSKLNITTAENLTQTFCKMTMEEAASYIKEKFSPAVSYEKILETIKETILSLYEEQIPAKSGAVEFIKSLCKEGILCAVATATEKTCAEKSLERTGLLKFIKKTVTTEKFPGGKNRPEIFYECARLLGSAPCETVIFEDSPFALETAKKAGFLTCGIYDSAWQKDRPFAEKMSDIFIDGWNEISASTLVQKISGI